MDGQQQNAGQQNAGEQQNTGQQQQQPQTYQQQPQQQQQQQPEKQQQVQSEVGRMHAAMDGNQQIVHATLLGKWGQGRWGEGEKYHLRITVQANNDTDILSGVQQAARDVLRRYSIPGSLMKRTYFSRPAKADECGEVDMMGRVPVHEIDPGQETIASALEWNKANGLDSEIWISLGGRGAGGAGGAAGAARVAGVPAEVLKVEMVDESYWFNEKDLEYVERWSGRDKHFSRAEGGVWWPCAPPEGR